MVLRKTTDWTFSLDTPSSKDGITANEILKILLITYFLVDDKEAGGGRRSKVGREECETSYVADFKFSRKKRE